jgi:hypothetical protein
MQFRSATSLLFIVFFGGIGVYILQTSHAATACGSGNKATPAQAQCIAKQLMNQPPYNWDATTTTPVGTGTMSYYECLQSLWNQESSWRWNASNATTKAYGVPQALPASSMASNGADWQTNAYTQIKWGLDYIQAQYGNPCSAELHEQQYHWYGIDMATKQTF